MNNKIEINTKVYASNCDNNQRLRFDTILNYFQDIATLHATEMKTDFSTLKSTSNAFWVLTKIKFKLEGEIKYNDNVTIRSWPLNPQLVRCVRDFVIDAPNGKVLGSSEWCMLDVDTLRIKKISSTCYPSELDHITDRSGASDFIKLNEDITESDYFNTYVCVYTDIDCNDHVNNVSYSKMALNIFTPDEFTKYNFNAFEINFISQAYIGDAISIYKKVTDNGVYVEGKTKDKPVFKCLFSKEL